jgi:hypothetical protein
VLEASIPELVGERIDQSPGASSIVAAVMWNAMMGQYST